jgi:hypothetical protein
LSVSVTPIRTRKELLDFAHFSSRIYQNKKYRPWTTPSGILQMLSPAHNPTWRQARYRCFLAMENERPVGRIASIIDPRNTLPQTGFFGAFETEERLAVAEKLFDAAEEWLASFGARKIMGPATFNTNQEVGLLIEGVEEPPQPFIPYNPAYYQNLVESCGFNKATDLISYHYPLEQGIPSAVTRVANRALQKKGLLIRHLNVTRLPRETETIRSILNQAMADNWGYIPLSIPETAVLLNYCFTQGDPSLALVITINSEPAAFSLCLPGIRQTNYCVRVAILAIVPRFRKQGLEALLIEKNLETLLVKGYSAVEVSQVEEENSPMTRILAKLDGCRPVKRHRVYQREINTAIAGLESGTYNPSLRF